MTGGSEKARAASSITRSVAVSRPFMLAKVFLPGWDAEDLDELIRTFRVAIELPAHRAGAQPRPPELDHRLQPVRLPFGGDGVVHRDQDGAGVGFDVEGQLRVDPVRSGRPRIETAGLRDPEEQPRHAADGRQDRRGQDGRSEPDLISDQSPEQRAAGLAGHERDGEDRDTASPDPAGQDQLELGLQSRGHRHPGDPAQHEDPEGGREAWHEDEQRQGGGVKQGSDGEDPIGGHAVLDPSEQQGAEDGAGPDRGEQSAEAVSLEP